MAREMGIVPKWVDDPNVTKIDGTTLVDTGGGIVGARKVSGFYVPRGRVIKEHVESTLGEVGDVVDVESVKRGVASHQK